MSTVCERMRTLREGMNLHQKKIAELLNVSQPSVNRYERWQAFPTIELLVKHTDYFDVFMDYLTRRCDEPQGKLYQAKPPVRDNPELAKFIDMCFEPDSPMNEHLKQALIQMLGEVKT